MLAVSRTMCFQRHPGDDYPVQADHPDRLVVGVVSGIGDQPVRTRREALSGIDRGDRAELADVNGGL